jgi:hypothetical protein
LINEGNRNKTVYWCIVYWRLAVWWCNKLGSHIRYASEGRIGEFKMFVYSKEVNSVFREKFVRKALTKFFKNHSKSWPVNPTLALLNWRATIRRCALQNLQIRKKQMKKKSVCFGVGSILPKRELSSKSFWTCMQVSQASRRLPCWQSASVI